jgi:hypothetical protein
MKVHAMGEYEDTPTQESQRNIAMQPSSKEKNEGERNSKKHSRKMGNKRKKSMVNNKNDESREVSTPLSKKSKMSPQRPIRLTRQRPLPQGQAKKQLRYHTDKPDQM